MKPSNYEFLRGLDSTAAATTSVTLFARCRQIAENHSWLHVTAVILGLFKQISQRDLILTVNNSFQLNQH